MTKQETVDKLLSSPHLRHIQFDKAKHEYWYCAERVFHKKNAKKFNGITSLISKYGNVFDPKVAKFVAYRDGKTEEEVLAEWKQKNTDSIDYGTFIHDSADEMIKTGVINPACETELTNISLLLTTYGLEPLVGEYLITFDEIERASSIDLICWSYVENKLVVVDYKTPEKGIKFEAYKNQKLLYPINHLEDCSYNTYSIQTTFYVDRLRKLGFDVDDTAYLLYVRGEQSEMIPTTHYEKEINRIIQQETFKP